MENELDNLRNARAPEPSDAARRRAMAAAMQAFDDQKFSHQATQGLAKGHRQSSIATRIWSSIMNKRLLAGSALATLLVVPAAGYITLGVFRQTRIEVADVSVPAVKDAADKGRIAADDTAADGASTAPGQDAAASAEPMGKTETQAEPVAADEASDARERAAALPEEARSADTESGAAVGRLAEGGEADALVDTLAAAKPATTQPSGVLSKKVVGATVQSESALPPVARLDQSGDRFTGGEVNPVKSVVSEPVSTFSIDVDTASYAYARQAILSGRLPEPDSVRVEEMINYFPYDWAPPERADQPFKTGITVMPTPWNADTQLMHIAIQGYEMPRSEQRPANLVFLIDVSGSMDEPEKLPLLKSAFRLLVNRLRPDDTVSIVVYAGNSGTVLEPTKAADKKVILDAIDRLAPGGSTAGAEGIEAAYRLAEKAFVKDGVNRILLATDGDFNVGPSSDADLKDLIAQKRRTGIFLSVLGFGSGNYNDGLMQTLAQNGNGVAAYIDTLSEARKTLVQEATASLFPIAKDVKIQVEFNPDQIAEYRLIGYETRALRREDFNNDRVDAGEIGAGHRVTAIYEITPKGSPAVLNDDLRYAAKQDAASRAEKPQQASDELAFVKIRYKQPSGDKSSLVTMPVRAADRLASINAASDDVRFSVAVAAFGQKLKKETSLAGFSWDAVLTLASGAKGTDPFGYRGEFLRLVELAESLGAD
jgi:Ca-activated chloride channel family protein